jgi:hypothetical protein
MLKRIAAGGVLAEDPFVLVDVGCGLGIDPGWRLFGDHLAGYGFDPQVDEIERLRKEERGRIEYRAAFIGLPDDHPLRVRRAARLQEETFFAPFGRTSAAVAIARAARAGDATFYETNAWPELELATETLGLADALQRESVDAVDFVKIDTDGSDLDVLISFEKMLGPASVLGVMVETPFTGSDDESANTFHNIDPILKRNGFQLYAMTMNKYSRAALPARFAYSIFAQTVSGQPMWGDLVYLRETAHPDWRRYGDLSPTKLLKLACLHELFEVPDCAAELLLEHRAALAELVDVDELLELLTPPLQGDRVTYAEYVAAFEVDPTTFYPGREPAPAAAMAATPRPPALVARAKRVAARVLGRV